MKAKLLPAVLIVFAFCISCQEDILNNNSEDKNQLLNKSTGCKDIVIEYEAFENAIIEDYIIDTVYIEEDSLIIHVNYGGGCGSTNFELVTHGYFMESYPVQLNVILDIEDNDPCEALLQETICFNLAELAMHYNQSYQSNGGTIIIHLEEYEEALIYEF